jgi:hypothetical protein
VYLRLPVEITSRLEMAAGPVAVDAAAGGFACELAIANPGAEALETGLFAVLHGLPPGATVRDASGLTPEGLPYFALEEPLAAGERRTVTLRFDAADGVEIAFQARLYSAL